MEISSISNMNFKAICRGQYENLKRISMENGTDISKIERLEKTIQKLFPDNNQILKFNIVGNNDSFTSVAIQLMDNKNKVIEQVDGNVLPKDIRFYEKNEVRMEKSKVFAKVVNMVKKLKKGYSSKLKTEQEISEKEKNTEIQAIKTLSPSDMKCVISPDISIIKRISVDAGYPADLANKLEYAIKKRLSQEKYYYKIFYLKLDETLDIKGKRQYMVYYGITNNLDVNAEDYNRSKGIFQSIISNGVTQEDRKNLFENVYNLIKNHY